MVEGEHANTVEGGMCEGLLTSFSSSIDTQNIKLTMLLALVVVVSHRRPRESDRGDESFGLLTRHFHACDRS